MPGNLAMRGKPGAQPSDLARPGWLVWPSMGSLWRVSWATIRVAWHVLARVPALGALAGSICKPRALLARPGWFDVASRGPIWMPWALWLARFGRPGRSWLALAGQGLPHRRD